MTANEFHLREQFKVFILADGFGISCDLWGKKKKGKDLDVSLDNSTKKSEQSRRLHNEHVQSDWRAEKGDGNYFIIWKRNPLREGPGSSPSIGTWTPNQKGRESSFRFVNSSRSKELSLFLENWKIAAGKGRRGVQIRSSHLSYSIWQKPRVTQNEKPQI